MRLETMSCRSASRCAACEHFSAGACALEAQLEEALLALARARRKEAAGPLRLVDARRLGASA